MDMHVCRCWQLQAVELLQCHVVLAFPSLAGFAIVLNLTTKATHYDPILTVATRDGATVL